MIWEYADLKEDLTVILLDAEKAFDRVWHDNLFCKLFHIGIPSIIWHVIRNWYQGFQSQIQWNGILSNPISILLLTIQGGGLSLALFKMDINPILKQVESRHLGATISMACCSIPPCADDVAILVPSASPDVTRILSIVEDHSNWEHRSINSSKSPALHYQHKKTNPVPLYISHDMLPVKIQSVHLGILQGISKNINAERLALQIFSATRVLCSLFGAGLHGRNGISPVPPRKLWKAYIWPHLIHGSELWIINQGAIKKLEVFQRKKLKQLQGLPDHTLSHAVHGLFGTLAGRSRIRQESFNPTAQPIKLQKLH